MSTLEEQAVILQRAIHRVGTIPALAARLEVPVVDLILWTSAVGAAPEKILDEARHVVLQD